MCDRDNKNAVKSNDMNTTIADENNGAVPIQIFGKFVMLEIK